MRESTNSYFIQSQSAHTGPTYKEHEKNNDTLTKPYQNRNYEQNETKDVLSPTPGK